MNESQGPGGRETQHRPGVPHRHSPPAVHICFTLGQLTFFGGGGGGGGRLYCFVVLCFAFIISPCCVLFSLSLPFFFAFVFIYFWYVCTVFLYYIAS